MKKIVVSVVFLFISYFAKCDPYNLEDIQFISHQTQLSGTLVSPKEGNIYAAVVFVHGSGKQTRNINLAKRFAADGIAAFVYDKRGVGRSDGHYESKQSVSEQNINLLADDAIAALKVINKHAKTKALPKGLTGISQAGWIAPIALEKSNLADFMVLWSAPICKVSEEDIFSIYTADLDGAKIPSYNEALQSRKQPYIWPDFLGKDSDPNDSIAKLAIPALWIFGEKDGSIPVDLSLLRLNKHIEQGHQYEYVLFSGSGHNNMPETIATAIDWIKRVSK